MQCIAIQRTQKVTEEMLYNVQEEMKRIVEKDLKIEKEQ